VTPSVQTGPQPQSPVLAWVAVTACMFAIAINYADRATIALAGPQIRDEFGIGAAEFGALQSAWSLAFAAAQLPVGWLVDRFGAWLLLGCSLALWSLAQAAGGWFLGFEALLISRIALGVFESPGYPAAARVISDFFRPVDRGPPTGFYTVGGDLGRIVGMPALTILMLAHGWRAMFVIVGLVGVVAAGLWFALVPRPTRVAVDPPLLLAASVADWRRLFQFRAMWGLILGSFCSGYAVWMYATWLPGYLEIQHGLSIARTGWLATLPLIASVIGSVVGGLTTGRLAAGNRSLIISCKIPMVGGYLAAACFCGLAAAAPDMPAALSAIAASMFALSFAQSGKWTLVTAVAPAGAEASVASIANFGSYIGGALSPFLTGLIVDRTGSFVIALVVGAIVMGVGAGLYGLIVVRPIPPSTKS
jgi:MFS family permease